MDFNIALLQNCFYSFCAPLILLSLTAAGFFPQSQTEYLILTASLKLKCKPCCPVPVKLPALLSFFLQPIQIIDAPSMYSFKSISEPFSLSTPECHKWILFIYCLFAAFNIQGLSGLFFPLTHCCNYILLVYQLCHFQ